MTGRSIAQSRLSLLFNAVAKIPMQLFILFIGAMVFVLFLFREAAGDFPACRSGPRCAVAGLDDKSKSNMTRRLPPGVMRRCGWRNPFGRERTEAKISLTFHRADSRVRRRRETTRLASWTRVEHTKGFNDTNYIFLTYVTKFLPVGVVGLLIAVIFSAAMSSSSGEINSLATVSVIDIYRRYRGPQWRATGIISGRRGCSRCSGRLCRRVRQFDAQLWRAD